MAFCRGSSFPIWRNLWSCKDSEIDSDWRFRKSLRFMNAPLLEIRSSESSKLLKLDAGAREEKRVNGTTRGERYWNLKEVTAEVNKIKCSSGFKGLLGSSGKKKERRSRTGLEKRA